MAFRAFVLLTVLLAAPAFAAPPREDYDPTRIITAETKEDFAPQYQAVLDGMKPGGAYDFLRPRDRELVLRRLHEINRLLERYVPGTRLRDSDMTALLTAQEEVNGILTRHEGDALVCTTQAPAGSHIPANQCKRREDVERNRRATQKWMRDRMAVPCSGGCGF